jgi:hypothetical protein
LQLETRQQYAIQSATSCGVKGKQLLVLGHGTGMQVSNTATHSADSLPSPQQSCMSQQQAVLHAVIETPYVGMYVA